MFKKLIQKQQELQNVINTTEKKVTNLSNSLQRLEDENRLENIEKSINDIDLDYLKKLNSNIEKLIKHKKITTSLLAIIIVLIIIGFIYLFPLSPIYQKTRQQIIVNDILEERYYQLKADDEAIKALEKCTNILQELQNTKQKNTETVPENE